MLKRKEEKYTALTEVQQEYIRIYHSYFVLQWEMHELCEHFQCTNTKIKSALKWVIDNKGNFPPEYLIEGAISAIRERMKINRGLLDTELDKTKNKDKRFIIELNREIRADEDRLFKLQQLVGNEVDKDSGIRPSDVLKLVAAAQNE